MNLEALNKIANAMVSPGKGILAADESNATMTKRLEQIGAQSTPDTRRDWREMLFRTDPTMRERISGVILYDETLRQNAKDGTPLVKLIEKAGAVPGIKVDMGPKPLAGAKPGEVVTEGLDGLRERLQEYHKLGARFAKWRAVIEMGRGGDRSVPSWGCIKANAHALARYAALCQECGIVPIVEPEALMDGDHDVAACYDATLWALKTVYAELYEANVALEGTILKPNMVLAGKKAAKQASVAEVAEKTVKALRAGVPAAVPGIAFLSGGQSDFEATAHLNAMNAKYGATVPWKLSFSYGRALQQAPLKAWSGKPENFKAGQAAFAHRARMNGLAQLGEWSDGLEKAA